MLEAVRIAPNLSFGDIDSGRVSLSRVYETLVSTWIFDTSEVLLREYPPDNSFRGMAALSLLIQFFEPHGEMLLGQDSMGRSRQCFCTAFNVFASSTGIKELPRSEEIYAWARCGLFHEARLSPRLLIDAFAIHNKPFYRNPVISEGWLVNPSALGALMRSYVKRYLSELSASPESQLAKNFNIQFGKAISRPLLYLKDAFSRSMEPKGTGKNAECTS